MLYDIPKPQFHILNTHRKFVFLLLVFLNSIPNQNRKLNVCKLHRTLPINYQPPMVAICQALMVPSSEFHATNYITKSGQ